MPTNRTKIRRGRTGPSDVSSWLRWETGIVRYLSDLCKPPCPWTPESSTAFWSKYKDEILSVYLEQNRQKGCPGLRPDIYFAELAEENPRQIIIKKRFGPMSPSGEIPVLYDEDSETDFDYLKRLGLLEPWEMEAQKERACL